MARGTHVFPAPSHDVHVLHATELCLSAPSGFKPSASTRCVNEGASQGFVLAAAAAAVVNVATMGRARRVGARARLVVRVVCVVVVAVVVADGMVVPRGSHVPGSHGSCRTTPDTFFL